MSERYTKEEITEYLRYHFEKNERHQAVGKSKWIILQLCSDLEALQKRNKILQAERDAIFAVLGGTASDYF